MPLKGFNVTPYQNHFNSPRLINDTQNGSQICQKPLINPYKNIT